MMTIERVQPSSSLRTCTKIGLFAKFWATS